MDFLKKFEEMAMDDPEASGDGGRAQGGQGFSELLHSASSMLSSQQQHKPAPHSDPTAAAVRHQTNYEQEYDEPSEEKSTPQVHAAAKPAYGDLLGSAKLLMEAAQGKQGADKSEIAAAASNILGGVSSYAKLDDQPYGDYIRKAQGYLQSYGGKQGGVPSHDASDPPAFAYADSAPHADPEHAPSAKPFKSQSPDGYSVDEEYPSDETGLPARRPGYGGGHPPPSANRPPASDDNAYDDEYSSSAHASYPAQHAPGHGYRPPASGYRPSSDEFPSSGDYSSSDYDPPKHNYGRRPPPPSEDGYE